MLTIISYLMMGTRTGGERMRKMLRSGMVSARGGLCIDLYNQTVWHDIFVTVTTRIDECNHYWVSVEE